MKKILLALLLISTNLFAQEIKSFTTQLIRFLSETHPQT
jgi:hypothetical protein